MAPDALGIISLISSSSLALNFEEGVSASRLRIPGSSLRSQLVGSLALTDRGDVLSWSFGEVIGSKLTGPTPVDQLAEAAIWLATMVQTYSPDLDIRLDPGLKIIASEAPELLEPLAPIARLSAVPRGNLGWDNLVDPWVESIPAHGEKIPSAYRIWQSSHRYLKGGDIDRARRCEELNYLLHNSYVPAKLKLVGEITFSYGGIGVIVHPDADIAPGVTIGANVTIGGSGSKVREDSRTGRASTVPKLGEMVTIGACCNISGGIEIGPMSIIAPNAVVTNSTPPGAIMAGVPAKQIGQVTVQNLLKYKVKYLPARSLTDEAYIEKAKLLLTP